MSTDVTLQLGWSLCAQEPTPHELGVVVGLNTLDLDFLPEPWGPYLQQCERHTTACQQLPAASLLPPRSCLTCCGARAGWAVRAALADLARRKQIRAGLRAAGILISDDEDDDDERPARLN